MNIRFVMIVLFLSVGWASGQTGQDTTRTADTTVSVDSAKGAGTEAAAAAQVSGAPLDSALQPSNQANVDLEKNRVLAKSLDSSIAFHRQRRGVAIAGIVVGGVITLVGAVMTQIEAQEEAERRAQDSPGTVQTSFGVNVLGLLIGIPITAISTVFFIKSTVKMNQQARQKRRLNLTLVAHPNGVALRF